ncbi:MAG: relaxase/mobilization nuclease domain-containing protein [Candidatus Dormibacterales bacterium]
MGDRVILLVRHTRTASDASARRAAGRLLRYVQGPQGGREGPEPRAGAEDRGPLFDRHGIVGGEERRDLAAFIGGAVRGMPAQLGCDARGRLVPCRRAYYGFVLSPERAEGLDLRLLTRAAMAALEGDAGGELRWIAGEHRDTAHPHTHIVVAARREIAPGRLRNLLMTGPRLAHMREALAWEVRLQREMERDRERAGEKDVPGSGRRAGRGPRGLGSLVLRRMAARYRLEAEREALERRRGREMEP